MARLSEGGRLFGWCLNHGTKGGSGSHTRSIIRKITIIAETAKSRYTAWNQKKDAACFLSRWSLVRVFAAPTNFSLLNHQL